MTPPRHYIAGRPSAIEVEKCAGNVEGRPVKVVASIDAPEVINKILKHLRLDEGTPTRNRSPPIGLC
ncbi:MAG: hypothetical protein HOI74_18780 [Gammaproteobacteria bacterium]|nr:hypothetical protein [Gammaproteobacteria bacterium]